MLNTRLNFNSPTLHPYRFLYLNPPKSADIRGYPRISADIRLKNGYPLSADIKSVKKRISVIRGYQIRGQNGYPLSADIKSWTKRISVIREYQIRGQNGYPLSRISNPWTKRISVIRGYQIRGQNGYPLSRISNPWTKRISISNGYPFQIRGYPWISADIRRISADFFEDFLDTKM